MGKAYDTASNLYPQGAGSQPGESKTWDRLSGADRTDIIGKARDAFRIQAGRDPTSQEETELGTKIAAYYDQTNGDVAQTITYGQKISSEIGTSKKPGPPPDITKMTDQELTDILRGSVPNVSVNAPKIGAVSTLIQDKLRAARALGEQTMTARRAQTLEVLATEREKEYGRIAGLEKTYLPEFARAREPLIQQQIAQAQQAAAEQGMAATEQLRKQYAAAGRDVDLPQSGALLGAQAGILGRQAATVTGVEGNLRAQAAQSAQDALNQLQQQQYGFATQRLGQLGQQELAAQEELAGSLREQQQGLVTDILTQSSQDWQTEQARVAKVYDQYEFDATQALTKLLGEKKIDQEQYNNMNALISSIFASSVPILKQINPFGIFGTGGVK